MRHRLIGALVALVALVVLVLGASLYAWTRYPLLTVYVDPRFEGVLDRAAYLNALNEAGVKRLRLVDGVSSPKLGYFGKDVDISLTLSAKRNPQLDEEMLAMGLTGPGYTEGHNGVVYQPDVRLFIKKHWARYKAAGMGNYEAVERRIVTNAAVHETWHAITLSTSHNVDDKTSVMYIDPGDAALEYGSLLMPFTKGHRDRLREMFDHRVW